VNYCECYRGSENKGIDSIIEYVNKNQKIKTIIVCGKEVSGHKAAILYLNYTKMELIKIKELSIQLVQIHILPSQNLKYTIFKIM